MGYASNRSAQCTKSRFSGMSIRALAAKGVHGKTKLKDNKKEIGGGSDIFWLGACVFIVADV